MDTELVFTGNGDIFCDSMKISEKLDVPHKDLLRTIEKILKKKQCADQHLVNSQKFIETQFTNKQGRTYKKYDLNEPAFIKLVMQLKGYKRAEIVQDMFVEAFMHMKRVLQEHTNASWIEARQTGKVSRLAETDTIQEFVEYATKQGNTKAKFYYSTLTNLTYKALELMKCETPIRDLLNNIGLQYLAELERQVQYELQDGMKQGFDYKHIYANCKDRLEKYCEFIPERIQLKIN